jgi:hypothetical protein
MQRRKGISALLIATALAGTMLIGVLATPAEAAVRHLDGTVLSKNGNAKTFRITTQGGSQVTVRVNANTRFQRIAGGFSGLRKGLRIEVEARTTGSGLLATHVEPKESGSGGGGHGGGENDGPNHH